MRNRDPSALVTMARAITTVAVCTLPLFLTGALAVQLTNDLRFTATGLGLAVASYRLVAAASVGFLGRLADRYGPENSMRLAVGLTLVSTLGIAFSARSLLGLIVWLALSAMGRSLSQPAVNRLLVERIPPNQQGRAFGIKQSGGPTSSMLAGASVPLIASTFGWRPTFVVTAALALLVIGTLGRPSPVTRTPTAKRGERASLDGRRTLTIAFVAFTLSSGASSVLPAFFVASATADGLTTGRSGTLLAAASLAAIGVRVVSGFACDRLAHGHLRLVTGMLMIGALGTLGIASGRPGLIAIGILVGLAGTWGFDGVFWYSIVRAYPDQAGQVTGALEPGGLIGGAGTPLLFGLIVDVMGFSTAWFAGAALSLAGAVAMLITGRLLAAGQ